MDFGGRRGCPPASAAWHQCENDSNPPNIPPPKSSPNSKPKHSPAQIISPIRNRPRHKKEPRIPHTRGLLNSEIVLIQSLHPKNNYFRGPRIASFAALAMRNLRTFF